MADEKTENLFLQYKATGDIALRNKIAEKYLYIADILAKKFAHRGVEYDDLKQVASYALLRGIDRFDPSLGMQFTTFITPTIAGEIKNYFRDKSRMIKVPRRLSELSAQVKRFSDEYEAQHGKKPNQKLKPYLVQQYLLQNTDEDHVASLSACALSDSLNLLRGEELVDR